MLRTDLISKTILWKIEGGRRYFFIIAFFFLKLSPFALRRFQSRGPNVTARGKGGGWANVLFIGRFFLRLVPFH